MTPSALICSSRLDDEGRVVLGWIPLVHMPRPAPKPNREAEMRRIDALIAQNILDEAEAVAHRENAARRCV